MTAQQPGRPRPIVRPRRRGLRDAFAGEERQEFLVTALFVGLIGLLVLILIGAVGLAWYNDNLRPLARVGPTEILPGSLRDYRALQEWRYEREEGLLRTAVAAHDIDQATFSARLRSLEEQARLLAANPLEPLIDLTYQAQLAGERGITVADGQVDGELAATVSALEQRRVLAIFVEPAENEDGQTTATTRRQARERAEQALAALDGGAGWATVAAEYSSHESAGAGGDFGDVTRLSGPDQSWIEALFDLPQDGTTEVIRGDDGTYRIGRVVSISPGPEQPGERERLFGDVSEDAVRQILHNELAVEQLEQQVVAEALTGTPEQIRLAAILIEGVASGDPDADEGEVRYSEVVYAPNDDLLETPEDPNDPAWLEAQARAARTAQELRDIEDVDERTERLTEIAAAESVGTSGDIGGEQVQTRGLLPTELVGPLFDEDHADGDVIGPVRTEAAYYVIIFHEHRESPEAPDGGELGWVTRETLHADIVGRIFALRAGQHSAPIELGDGTYIFKALERAERPIDPDLAVSVRRAAFADWYAPLKAEAEQDGTIVRADEGSEDEFDFGEDFDPEGLDFDDFDPGEGPDIDFDDEEP